MYRNALYRRSVKMARKLSSEGRFRHVHAHIRSALGEVDYCDWDAVADHLWTMLALMDVEAKVFAQLQVELGERQQVARDGDVNGTATQHPYQAPRWDNKAP